MQIPNGVIEYVTSQKPNVLLKRYVCGSNRKRKRTNKKQECQECHISSTYLQHLVDISEYLTPERTFKERHFRRKIWERPGTITIIISIKRINISKVSNTGNEFHRKNISSGRFEKKVEAKSWSFSSLSGAWQSRLALN